MEEAGIEKGANWRKVLNDGWNKCGKDGINWCVENIRLSGDLNKRVVEKFIIPKNA